jgi:hypothetical protein
MIKRMKTLTVCLSMLFLLPCAIRAQEIINLYSGPFLIRATSIAENSSLPANGMYNG